MARGLAQHGGPGLAGRAAHDGTVPGQPRAAGYHGHTKAELARHGGTVSSPAVIDRHPVTRWKNEHAGRPRTTVSIFPLLCPCRAALQTPCAPGTPIEPACGFPATFFNPRWARHGRLPSWHAGTFG